MLTEEGAVDNRGMMTEEGDVDNRGMMTEEGNNDTVMETAKKRAEWDRGWPLICTCGSKMLCPVLCCYQWHGLFVAYDRNHCAASQNS